MKTISLSEFKKNTQQVIHSIMKGQKIILTYHGKAVCRLEPLNNKKVARNDPFYELYRLADETAENLTKELNLKQALTKDNHFTEAGFTPLLI